MLALRLNRKVHNLSADSLRVQSDQEAKAQAKREAEAKAKQVLASLLFE